MPASDSDERSTLYLAGLMTDGEAGAYERDLISGTAEEPDFAALHDAVALTVMAGTPRRPAPATVRGALMAAAGITADPAHPVLDKFTYLMNGEGWNEPMLPGIRIKPLFTNPKTGHRAFLLELEPGTQLPEHPHAGYEECLILRGDLINEGCRMGPGDYVRATPSTQHLEVYTEQGCLCLIIASAA